MPITFELWGLYWLVFFDKMYFYNCTGKSENVYYNESKQKTMKARVKHEKEL